MPKRVTFSECDNHVHILPYEDYNESSIHLKWTHSEDCMEDFRCEVMNIMNKLKVGYGLETVDDNAEHCLRGLELYFEVSSRGNITIKGKDVKQARKRCMRNHVADVLTLQDLNGGSSRIYDLLESLGRPISPYSRRDAHYAQKKAEQDQDDVYCIYTEAFGSKIVKSYNLDCDSSKSSSNKKIKTCGKDFPRLPQRTNDDFKSRTAIVRVRASAARSA